MNTERDGEFAGIDARLAQLPDWQPPADFAVRLAAAAARQSVEPVPARLSTRAWLWHSVVRRLPLACASVLLALALVVLPWARLAVSPVLPWSLVACGAVVGILLTWRVIRAP